MTTTAPADGPKGWTDGPARDPDRVTGSADRPRSRRASARRVATTATPASGHSLALTGRSSGRPPQLQSTVDGRGSPPPPRTPTNPIEATPNSSSSASLRRFRARTIRAMPDPAAVHRPTPRRPTSFALHRARRMSVAPLRQPSYACGGRIRTDAGRGERIAARRRLGTVDPPGRSPRGAHALRGARRSCRRRSVPTRPRSQPDN